MDLDKEIMRLKKQIEDEIESKETLKRDYEKRIKELEDQITMLRSESGDIVQQLENKIKQMSEDHEKEKEEQYR